MQDCQNIDWSPENYSDASFIAREAGDELLSRLSWLRLDPKVIVDVGAGLCETTIKLKGLYQAASVIALDLSPSMLAHHRAGLLPVCGEANLLPIASQAVDLVVANLLFPWISSEDEMKKILRECQRVLKPEGVLLLSLLGPDSLKQITDPSIIVPKLIDIHDIGDLLLQEGWSDPVLDVMRYDVSYTDSKKMANELQIMGMITKTDSAFVANEIHYEVVYAHTFAPSVKQKSVEGNNTYIPLSAVRETLVKKSLS